jgi:hypothetical protein
VSLSKTPLFYLVMFFRCAIVSYLGGYHVEH